jgi:hypothetical protein
MGETQHGIPNQAQQHLFLSTMGCPPRDYAMWAVWARRLWARGMGTIWIIYYWVLVIWLLGTAYMTMAIGYG